jgi:cobalt/nickel transport system permease protein
VENKVPSFLLHNTEHRYNEYHRGHRVRSAFLDRGLVGLSRVLKDTYVQWDLSKREGLFQRLDPRLKLLFLAFFVVAISLKREIASELIILFILLILNLFSRLKLIPLYSRILVFTFFFGALLSFPSAFNAVVPGTVIVPLVTLDMSHDFLCYQIPKTVGLTKEGLYLMALLSLRVANSLTVCQLVLSTTPFPDLAKALGLLRVPDIIVMIVTLFHKYLFILSCSLEEMHLAMKSRLVSAVLGDNARLWATSRMAYLYRKSHQTCEEVFRAMLSRGFSGEMRLTGPHPLSGINWLAGPILLAVWFVIVLL